MTSTYSNLDLSTLPGKFKLSVECQYLSGDNKAFGIRILDRSESRFLSVNLYPNTAVDVQFIQNGLLEGRSKVINYGSVKELIEITGEFSGRDLQLAVNGKRFETIKMDFAPVWLRLFASRSQIVQFDNVKFFSE